MAVVALGAGFAQLVVTGQGVMYLTRGIDTARRFEARPAGNEQAIDAGSPALELQRSLDYESQFDQTPIGDLVHLHR